jgi:hypothetical protein
MLTRPSKCLPGCLRKQACSFGHHLHFARSVASMARPVRLVHLALDARAQISAFVKLKLRICARPEPRAGFFAWSRNELKFPGSAEEYRLEPCAVCMAPRPFGPDAASSHCCLQCRQPRSHAFLLGRRPEWGVIRVTDFGWRKTALRLGRAVERRLLSTGCAIRRLRIQCRLRQRLARQPSWRRSRDR